MNQTEIPSPVARQLQGVVVYFYAFDFAYDMQPQPVTTLLGQVLEPVHIDPRKRSPRGQNFFRPLMATLPPLERCDASSTSASSARLNSSAPAPPLCGPQMWPAIADAATTSGDAR